MLDIQALRKRLANGENAADLAEEIKDDAEIVQAGFAYECKTIALRREIIPEAQRYNLNWLLDRLESWRKAEGR